VADTFHQFRIPKSRNAGPPGIQERADTTAGAGAVADLQMIGGTREPGMAGKIGSSVAIEMTGAVVMVVMKSTGPGWGTARIPLGLGRTAADWGILAGYLAPDYDWAKACC